MTADGPHHPSPPFRGRVLVACDFDHRLTTTLLAAVADEIARRPGWRLVGVCDAGLRRPRPSHRGIAAVVYRVLHGRANRPAVVATIERLGAPILDSPSGSINDPDFVETVRGLEIDLALSLYGLQIWSPALLAAVHRPVNCHDGSLPAHAGLWATSYSIYDGDPTSSITFHDMVPDIDAGPILVEEAVPVGPDDDRDTLVSRKTEAIVRTLPAVFDLVSTGVPGRPQVGSGCYHSATDGRALIEVTDPTCVTTSEIERRIRSFGAVRMPVDGRVETVTAVAPRPRLAHPTVRTLDGSLAVTGIGRFPALPYLAVRRLAGRRLDERLS